MKSKSTYFLLIPFIIFFTCTAKENANTITLEVINFDQRVNYSIMVEAVNKHMKYYYLFRKGLADMEAVTKHLTDCVENYNNKPHGRLHGFTPKEVLDGAVPVANQFQQAIIHARKERLMQNQEMKCCQEEL